MATFSLFTDSHAHIHGKEFQGDLDEMLDRARREGVGTIITVGTDLESSEAAVACALSRPGVYATVGIHPHDASDAGEAAIERLERLAREHTGCVVAIGETGLDFYRDRSPRHLQEELFRQSIRLARRLDLPLVIHDRDAHERILAILDDEDGWSCGGVMHCFSGDAGMARYCIERGFLISIPGTVTYPNSDALREVVRSVRVESMLIESDCPYLSPVPHRGKRNEPAFIRNTAAAIAELKNLSIEDVGRITSHNARRLFRLGTGRETGTIAYRIRNSLYLNITNRCSNRCSFCPKFDDFMVKGHHLRLDHEPTVEEILSAVGEPAACEEIVFCGYGEPLIRLDAVKEVARELKKKGGKIRVNTDGQANLVHGRNIIPELAGLVDTLSVSLNAADPETYVRLCNSPFGERGFKGVCEFIREAAGTIPTVIATAVTVPGVEIDRVRDLAERLGARFRIREYQEVG